ncbi:hypothetical protein EMA8858_01484 [Emticicia aquatica]|uniref:Uncharacterized protein n=1 Tax=Emticicia aquatica TaxID=1681835 RepID=A0ABM9AP09_9BACT|nr:hypothetical protein [Emticicia aquatica]CAH0995363.1 hypothetical protein EMA8858_01484 [Emticicia aquatica]
MKIILLLLITPISIFGQYTIQNNTSSVTILPNSIQTLKTNDTDTTNVAMGKDALKNNISTVTSNWGYYNVAIGFNSLYKTGSSIFSQAASNTAIGKGALYNNTIGSNNIAIGNDAGHDADDSDKLYITPYRSTFPLIWGDFKNHLLGFNGYLGIQTKTPADVLHIHDYLYPRSYARFTSTLSGSTEPNGLRIGISELNNGEIINYENNSLIFGTNALKRMTIAANGNVGINTELPNAQLDVNGFTKLGSDAPKIKLKKLTGTTKNFEGGNTLFLHELTPSKIIAINVLVEYSLDSTIPHGYTISNGYEFHFFQVSQYIVITTKTGNSSNILGKPIKILITYEE